MEIETIPLPIIDGEKLFKVNRFLVGPHSFNPRKEYFLCVSSIVLETKQKLDKIYTLYCDAIDITVYNPDQIITRFSQSGLANSKTQEWYKIDKESLDHISLKISPAIEGRCAITLLLKKNG